jgi:hypothetical protein
MPHRKLTLALAAAAFAALPGITPHASSHREAPFITEMPKVDGTDFYMFASYEPGRSDYVTMIANYQPLQVAYGGPSYFFMDPEALYEIHVDNNGDAKEDITFQFRFRNTLADIKVPAGGVQTSIPLINAGGITAPRAATLNLIETYSVRMVPGHRRFDYGKGGLLKNASTGEAEFVKPVDNIGNKSIPDYAGYAAQHIYNVNIPGCAQPGKVFVGQRKEPFVVNLGEIFDLVNTNPLGAPDAEVNIIDDANITSLILEVHKSCLTKGNEPVIGAWTTSSLRQARVLRPVPSFDKPSIEGGPWVQVSRLGMPLVNEVVIGLKDKDRFNASKPENDAQFAQYVTNPSFPELIEILFKDALGIGDLAPNNFPRNDLVIAFLTGVPGLNQPANVKASEMLRLNTSIAPTPKGSQKRLGVLEGDNAGFPNGRRPGDDVVDSALRVTMGVLCTINVGCAPADAPVGGAALTDGAFVDDSAFGNAFPYLATPIPGSPSN